MATITISVSEEELARLRSLAERSGLTPEEFVRTRVGRILDDPDEAFARAADYVLRKNAELYRRLS